MFFGRTSAEISFPQALRFWQQMSKEVHRRGSEATGLVSVIIPSYNPTGLLLEALASVKEQTYPSVEIVLVNDGSDKPEAQEILKAAGPLATRVIDRPNAGPAAARNAGFRESNGAYLLPLDSDDLLAPTFIAECRAALEEKSEAAFVYSDYRVFGDRSYVEVLPEYNLYRLLDQNTIPYASLIRRQAWEAAGGYGEAMRLGYEDWDFWLRLAEKGHYGYHLPRALFFYRKSGQSRSTTAEKNHSRLVDAIRGNHPSLYSAEGRRRIKRNWAPAVCVLGKDGDAGQTIEDVQYLPLTNPREAAEQSKAEAFLVCSGSGDLEPHSAELCALSVWAGRPVAKLPGDIYFVSRHAMASARSILDIARKVSRGTVTRPADSLAFPGLLGRIHRHMVNAELTSLETWMRRPGRSLARLTPLRVKERVNHVLGRPVFDLSFYLQFQPKSVLISNEVIPLLRYMPRPSSRRRIALVTPHLGPGGAETVLVEIAQCIDRQRFEVFLIATQSRNSQWRLRWEQCVDHVYDLAALIPPGRLIGALYAMAHNWEFDSLMIQNSLSAYSAIPHLKRGRPALKITDLIHAVDPEWDFASATSAVASQLDCRLVVSDSARQRLLELGVSEEKIRLIRYGIDLDRYRPAPASPPSVQKKILFCGRLDPAKRPLLLVDIALELRKLRPQCDFRFLVAGDGPERDPLRIRLRHAGLEDLFEVLGHIDETPPLFAKSDVLVLPSKSEGIPIVVLEAFAAGRPVVCSEVGAINEVVDETSGILIQPGVAETTLFAAALHRLFEDESLRRSMGAAARRKVETEYNLERTRELYRSLVAG